MNTAEKTSFRCISASEAISLMRGEPPAIIFDVRDMASYQKAHVEGAAHLSEDRLLAWMKRLPKDAPVLSALLLQYEDPTRNLWENSRWLSISLRKVL